MTPCLGPSTPVRDPAVCEPEMYTLDTPCGEMAGPVVSTPCPSVNSLDSYCTAGAAGGDAVAASTRVFAAGSLILWWWRRRKVQVRILGRSIVSAVREHINQLADDEFPGMTLDEMREDHLAALEGTVSEEQLDCSVMLYERTWQRLVEKGILIDFQNGYFSVKGARASTM